MTNPKETIKEIIKNSTLVETSIDSSIFTEEVSDESFSSEGEEMDVKIGDTNYIIMFDVDVTWDSVNSGGDGYITDDYDTAENEDVDITINFILDDEGNEIEFSNNSFSYKENKDLIIELEKFVESLI
jgi:hypothetical protein